MKLFRFLIVIMFCAWMNNSNSFAQEPVLFESEGTDFWLTFMPNFHSNSPGLDSLYIFITSKYPTKGTIYYSEFIGSNVTPKEYHFEITQPNEIHRFSIWYRYVALDGFNNSGLITNNLSTTDCEVVSKKSFRVITEEKSTVYALDYADKTAEAFIALPVPALGKEYFVMSYNSDGRGEYNNISGQSTPSQFAIVAVENNTNIRISPKVFTARFGMEEQNITLNKGEVYFVQAKITLGNLRSDLSGTHITADKEIAVFAGHQRATLPVDGADGLSYANTSRDNLIEQIIPVHSWGRNAIITPFAQPTKHNYSNDWNDIFRVIAAKDNTEIRVNEILVATLNAGEFYEDALKPALVTSNNPIMVAQYKRTESSGFGGMGSDFDSDPLMLIVPPVEQYKADYNVINPQIRISGMNIFNDQFLTIISPNESTDKIYLDNVLLSPNIFVTIPNSGYSYALIKTTSGGHSITCADPISVLVYGYGNAVSYGYLGGMSFKDLEREKIALLVDTCFTNATFTFNETYNSGIKEYEVIESFNCNFTEELKSQWQLKLNIKKNNPEQIAYFTIRIRDLYDIDTVFSDTMKVNMFIISGGDFVVDKYEIDYGKCTISSLNSKGFWLKNIGSLEIELNNTNMLMFHNTNFTLGKSVFPIKLQPQDSVFIDVFYAPTVASNRNKEKDFDTLLLSNLCNHYLLTFEGTPVADTLNMDGRCGVPIRAIADSINLRYSIPFIYPNPTNSAGNSAGIVYRFSLADASDIAIKLYNSLGEFIEIIASDYLLRGDYEIDISTNHLTDGTYFLEIISPNEKRTTKFLVVR